MQTHRNTSSLLAVAAIVGELVVAALLDGVAKNVRFGITQASTGPAEAVWSYALVNLITAILLVALGRLLLSTSYPRGVGITALAIGLGITLYIPLVYSYDFIAAMLNALPMVSPASELALSAAVIAALGGFMLLRRGASDEK